MVTELSSSVPLGNSSGDDASNSSVVTYAGTDLYFVPVRGMQAFLFLYSWELGFFDDSVVLSSLVFLLVSTECLELCVTISLVGGLNISVVAPGSDPFAHFAIPASNIVGPLVEQVDVIFPLPLYPFDGVWSPFSVSELALSDAMCSLVFLLAFSVFVVLAVPFFSIHDAEGRGQLSHLSGRVDREKGTATGLYLTSWEGGCVPGMRYCELG